MENRQELDILSVATTVGSADEARRLAQLLIERRLAACVQVEAGIVSHYRWQGRVCEEPEVRLVIKTLPALRDAVEAFMAQEHPYDLPQFLACEMRGSAAYSAWVREGVAAT